MAEQKQDRLLDHSYDGIQEYDNPMPRWWVITFWATIVFSILYVLNVPGIGNGKGRIADYDADMAQAKALRAQSEPAGGPTAEQLAVVVADVRSIEAGKALFTVNCVACHRPDAGGLIGPNLTDDFWIHGGAPLEIRKTINEGVLAKGMPEWGKVFKPDQIDVLTAYVVSVHGTNPANPKAPEGNKITP